MGSMQQIKRRYTDEGQAMGAERFEHIEEADFEDAEARVLADLDLFQDWLAGHLAYKRDVTYQATGDDGLMQRLFDRCSVATLMAAVLGYNPRACVLAARELRSRYLDTQKAHVLKIAGAL